MEQITFKELVKHPRLFFIYAALLAAGWLAPRLFPDDCQKAVARLENLNDRYLKRGDSIQASKDQLYERYLVQKDTIKQQQEKDKVTDSLLTRLGKKAGTILKQNHHVTNP